MLLLRQREIGYSLLLLLFGFYVIVVFSCLGDGSGVVFLLRRLAARPLLQRNLSTDERS
jgi:hypothetical protein